MSYFLVPQMAPLNWLGLFVSFSAILLMFSSVNYFLFDPPAKTSSPLKTEGIINWKW